MLVHVAPCCDKWIRVVLYSLKDFFQYRRADLFSQATVALCQRSSVSPEIGFFFGETNPKGKPLNVMFKENVIVEFILIDGITKNVGNQVHVLDVLLYQTKYILLQIVM